MTKQRIITCKITEAQHEAREKLRREHPEVKLSEVIRAALSVEFEKHGIEWPDDMDSPGGWRGGPKRNEGNESNE